MTDIGRKKANDLQALKYILIGSSYICAIIGFVLMSKVILLNLIEDEGSITLIIIITLFFIFGLPYFIKNIFKNTST